MKVLIFSYSTEMYDAAADHYNGAGWIPSLINELKKIKEVELALSFFHPTDSAKVHREKIAYYPMYRASRRKNILKTIVGDWMGSIEGKSYHTAIEKVIKDFKPDVVHIFGSSNVFVAAQKFTTAPVVVHLQGLLNPYYHAFYPVASSKLDFLFNRTYFISNCFGKGIGFLAKRVKHRAKQEAENFAQLKYVMGRTYWDKLVAQLHNPSIEYFHVDELLRPIFYQHSNNLLRKKQLGPVKLMTTISPTVYKGLDVILKTAKVLKETTNTPFTWHIVGLESTHKLVKHFEHKLRIDHKTVDIKFLGIRKAQDFVATLQDSDLFIHPSYIDNSPNSVCEAQILGIPVIACNVGGLTTLIENGVTGRLVPANGTYELAHYIAAFKKSPEEFWAMAEKAQEIAQQRHAPKNVLDQLMGVYKTIAQKPIA